METRCKEADRQEAGGRRQEAGGRKKLMEFLTVEEAGVTSEEPNPAADKLTPAELFLSFSARCAINSFFWEREGGKGRGR